MEKRQKAQRQKAIGAFVLKMLERDLIVDFRNTKISGPLGAGIMINVWNPRTKQGYYREESWHLIGMMWADIETWLLFVETEVDRNLMNSENEKGTS